MSRVLDPPQVDQVPTADPFFALALNGSSCQNLPLEWQVFVQAISQQSASGPSLEPQHF